MALRQTTAPTTYPVTLAEAKLHLRVDTSDDDALITSMITAATEMVEQKTGRAIMSQTWELTLDAFPEAFELTRVPVQSITSVRYYDTTGALQTLDAGGYVLDNASADGFAHVVPAYAGSWPTSQDRINAVAVRYVAGYADAASVPESIKRWVNLAVGAMYANREVESTAQTFTLGFADQMLDRFKVW